jgi:hypothetical protein
VANPSRKNNFRADQDAKTAKGSILNTGVKTTRECSVMARIESILTVTQGGILYHDIAEIVRWIDFGECRENHDFFMPEFACDEAFGRCVARCSFRNPVMPFIEFFMVPLIRLEFEDPVELRDLLREMYRYGWKAYNID